MIATLPPEADSAPDEAALRGTRIHAALETGKFDDLAQDEAEDAQKMVESEKAIHNKWCADNAITCNDPPAGKEVRLWLNDPETMEPVLSGKLDLFYVTGDCACVIDFKSGAWNTRLTPSQRNFQLRVQAVLLWREFDGIKKIRVAFAKPNSFLDFTDYTATDLAYSEAEIMHTIWRTKQPGAPRRAGLHCRWCKAKAFCVESGAFAMLPSRVPVAGMSSTADVTALVETMTPDDLVAIFKKSSVISKILDAVKDRLKGMSAGELQVLGLGKKPGRKLDPITNPLQAYLLLKRDGIPEADMWAALNFSKPKLVEAVRKSKAGMTKKQIESWLFDNLLGPYIEKQRSDDSLEVL